MGTSSGTEPLQRKAVQEYKEHSFEKPGPKIQRQFSDSELSTDGMKRLPAIARFFWYNMG